MKNSLDGGWVGDGGWLRARLEVKGEKAIRRVLMLTLENDNLDFRSDSRDGET